jgi:hypothetical protein
MLGLLPRGTAYLLVVAVLLRAREFKVPVTEDDIKVSRDGPFFIVNINYSVPVNLQVYQHEVQFSSSFSGATF